MLKYAHEYRWICILLALAACSSETLPTVDCSGEIPSYEQVTALTKCSECHASTLSGSARRNAPTNVNYDTEAAAKASGTKAASEVNGGSMPPDNSGITLTDDEKQQLYKWDLCP
jgi:uncharacterized membrane protein